MTFLVVWGFSLVNSVRLTDLCPFNWTWAWFKVHSKLLQLECLLNAAGILFRWILTAMLLLNSFPGSSICGRTTGSKVGGIFTSCRCPKNLTLRAIVWFIALYLPKWATYDQQTESIQVPLKLLNVCKNNCSARQQGWVFYIEITEHSTNLCQRSIL